MRAVLIDPSDLMIEHRRRLDIDKQDELWEGEWHLVNPPKYWHPRLASRLLVALAPIAERLGLEANGDSTGIFRAPDDWRIPDLVFARPESATEEGLTTAELVVELCSPGDDSYAKLPFYAAVGVAEVLIVHQDRRVEMFRPADGEMRPVDASGGVIRSEVLGLTLSTVDGPELRITVGETTADV